MQGIFDFDQIEKLNLRITERFVDAGVTESDLPIPAEELALFCDYAHSGRILDLGCGWGRNAKLFAEEGFQYCGIDISPKMIGAAKSRSPHLDFRIMSFRKLDFPDTHFRGAWCCCALWYEPKRNIPNVLKELHRVMEPGGIFSSVEPYTGFSEESIDTIDDMEAFGATWLPDEFENVLTDAGFQVRVRAIQHHYGAMSFLCTKQD